jgi:serine/threonine-protein kinase
VLGLVDEAAPALAAALAAPLSARAIAAPQDPKVVDAYLRIRALTRGTYGTELADVERIANEALAASPDDPLLLASMSQVCAHLAFRDSDHPERWNAHGRDTARRALRRAPLLADAWFGLARNEWMAVDFPAACSALRQALDLNPGLTRAQEMLGTILLEIGDVDEAVLRLEAVAAADPSASIARTDLARAWVFRRRFDRADALLALPRDLPGDENNRLFQIARFLLWRLPSDPPGPPLPEVYSPIVARQGEFFDFIRAWRFGEPQPFSRLQEAMEWTRAIRSVRFRLVVMQVLAECAFTLGEVEAGLSTLRGLVELGLLDLQWMDHAPMLGAARARKEWAALRAPVAARAAEVRAAIAGDRGVTDVAPGGSLAGQSRT